MRLAAITLIALALGATSARADTGPYLDSATWPSVEAAHPLGPEGVPQVTYPFGIEDNPVTVSEWALQNWSWWTATADPAQLAKAMRAADWLLGHQDAAGAWRYAFVFQTAATHLDPPWISAMAQGQGISVLVRAYFHTADTRYLAAALKALGPLQKTIGQGGVVGDFDGVRWYEEYPSTPAYHVLNGFEFTLIGLHDLEPHAQTAADLFDAGIASLAARIARYDMPAQRSQRYAAFGADAINVKGSVYMTVHAVLTRALATITANQTLKDYAARWEGYLRPVPVPVPVAAAAIHPIIAIPAATTPPAPVGPPAQRPCRLGSRPLKLIGGLRCRTGRRVLAFYVHRRRAPRRWRCKTTSRQTCIRGHRRVSARYQRPR